MLASPKLLPLGKDNKSFILFFTYLFVTLQQNETFMTEIHKQYRLTSLEEPTDEMLQALMEEVAEEARKSSARAEAEKRRRLTEVAHAIAVHRSQRKLITND